MSEKEFQIRPSSNGWTASQDWKSGMILFNASTGEFSAIAGIDSFFAGIGSGERNRLGSTKSQDGSLGTEIYLLAAILTEESQPSWSWRFRNAHVLSSLPESDLTDFHRDLISSPTKFRSYAGEWLVSLVKNTSGGLGIASEWARKIQEKTKSQSFAQDDFLRSVQEAAHDAAGIPLQKHVKELWLMKDPDYCEENFTEVRRSLGFCWLPAAHRGKGAHSKRV